jgi:hypothetical protein
LIFTCVPQLTHKSSDGEEKIQGECFFFIKKEVVELDSVWPKDKDL